MRGPKKVGIISRNEEDDIDLIVDQTTEKMQYSNGKDDQVAAEIIELGDKTTNAEKIGKKDFITTANYDQPIPHRTKRKL